MDDFALSIFKVELKAICEHAAVAEVQLEEARRRNNREIAGGRSMLLPGERDIRIWLAVQSLLILAANASKLLWGSGQLSEKARAERAPLREMAGVSDDSPLKIPEVRNAFEHWDEEILRWLKTDPKAYGSWYIGSDEAFPPEGSQFGHYNPQTGMVRFRTRSVSLSTLCQALRQIASHLAGRAA